MRNTEEIKVWMIRNHVTGADVARDLGCTLSMVSHWLAGRRGSSHIDRWFREHGMPENLIGTAKKRKVSKSR